MNIILLDGFECDLCKSHGYLERKDIKKRLGMTVDRFNIVQCRCCHLISLSPQPTCQELSEFYKDYDSKKSG